jgi:hypothetical protein
VAIALPTPVIARAKPDVGALGPNLQPNALAKTGPPASLLGDYAAARLARIRNCPHSTASRHQIPSFANTPKAKYLRRCTLATSLIRQASVPSRRHPPRHSSSDSTPSTEPTVRHSFTLSKALRILFITRLIRHHVEGRQKRKGTVA